MSTIAPAVQTPAVDAPPPTKPVRVLFAGGGSGGHLSPGLAIAERLMDLSPDNAAIFACSERAIDRVMLERAGASWVPMPAQPLRKSARGVVRFVRGYRAARRAATALIEREQIDRVVSLGGFVAAPIVAAAQRLGVHTTLVNLDDPPGKSNRMMARRCDDVVTAVATSALPNAPVIGMPVRTSAIAPAKRSVCCATLGIDAQKHVLLITGASQGASSLNAFGPVFAAAHRDALVGWVIYHLAGADGADAVRAAYASAGVDAVVEPFQHEMGLAWGAATLALTRCGASSVAEAAINRVPCVFVPYPYHRDQHQANNARPLVDAGAATLMHDAVDPQANLKASGEVITMLLHDRDGVRSHQAAALAAHPTVDAGLVLAKRLSA